MVLSIKTNSYRILFESLLLIFPHAFFCFSFSSLFLFFLSSNIHLTEYIISVTAFITCYPIGKINYVLKKRKKKRQNEYINSLIFFLHCKSNVKKNTRRHVIQRWALIFFFSFFFAIALTSKRISIENGADVCKQIPSYKIGFLVSINLTSWKI